MGTGGLRRTTHRQSPSPKHFCLSCATLPHSAPSFPYCIAHHPSGTPSITPTTLPYPYDPSLPLPPFLTPTTLPYPYDPSLLSPSSSPNNPSPTPTTPTTPSIPTFFLKKHETFAGVFEYLSKGAVAKDHPDLKTFREDPCLNRLSAADDMKFYTHALRMDTAVDITHMPFTNYT